MNQLYCWILYVAYLFYPEFIDVQIQASIINSRAAFFYFPALVFIAFPVNSLSNIMVTYMPQ